MNDHQWSQCFSCGKVMCFKCGAVRKEDEKPYEIITLGGVLCDKCRRARNAT